MITTTDRVSGGYDLPMYNRKGVRISLDEWALLMGEGRSTADPTAGYHRVGYDVIGHHIVSTAWTGFDARPHLGGEPLIFETAVLCEDGADDHFTKWATEDDARRAHDEIVRRLRVGHAIAEGLRQILGGEE